MNDLTKLVKEYTAWKNKIKQSLADNFDNVVDLIIGGYGRDIFIETESEPLAGFVVESQPYIKKGIVINQHPTSGEYIIWYFQDNSFYLIEKNRMSQLLNIVPIILNPESRINPIYTRQLRANTENEIDFMIMLVNWSKDLIPHLKKRMKDNNPENISQIIEDMSSIYKENKI